MAPNPWMAHLDKAKKKYGLNILELMADAKLRKKVVADYRKKKNNK